MFKIKTTAIKKEKSVYIDLSSYNKNEKEDILFYLRAKKFMLSCGFFLTKIKVSWDRY